MSPLRCLPSSSFVAGAFLVSLLAVNHLAHDVLSSVNLFPPELEQGEYQKEVRRTIQQLIEGQQRHAPPEEMEKIRKEHQEATQRYLEFLRTTDR